MISRYSDCHFAEVMPTRKSSSSFLADCSFCGKGCRIIDSPDGVGYDLELTLRRWKDGDCDVEDMFERLKTELDRSFMMAFKPAQEHLQKGQSPKYKYSIDRMIWMPAPKESVSQLGAKDESR